MPDSPSRSLRERLRSLLARARPRRGRAKSTFARLRSRSQPRAGGGRPGSGGVRPALDRLRTLPARGRPLLERGRPLLERGRPLLERGRPMLERWRSLPPRSRLLSTLAGAIAAVVLVVLAFGGGSPKRKTITPEAQVRAVVLRFGVATTRKDYQEICDVLIAKTLVNNVEQLGLPCESAFKQGLGTVIGARLTLRAVNVDGRVAFAKVHTTAIGQPPSDDTLKLIRVGGQWRISSLNAPSSPQNGGYTLPAPAPAPKAPVIP